jgi:hypothetical protein
VSDWNNGPTSAPVVVKRYANRPLLRQLIGFYGDQMQSLVPRFLERSMDDAEDHGQPVPVPQCRDRGNEPPEPRHGETGHEPVHPVLPARGAGPKVARQESQSEPQPNAGLEAEIARLRAENEELRQQLAAKPARKAAGVKQTGEPG